MILEFLIGQQIFIYFLYVIFAFGITSFFNKILFKDKLLIFLFPCLLLILTIVLLALGLFNYSLLAGLAFVGSLAASLVSLFFSEN